MTRPDKPGFLSHPIPLWAALVAVLVAVLASGLFAFAVSLILCLEGVIGPAGR